MVADVPAERAMIASINKSVAAVWNLPLDDSDISRSEAQIQRRKLYSKAIRRPRIAGNHLDDTAVGVSSSLESKISSVANYFYEWPDDARLPVGVMTFFQRGTLLISPK